MNLSRCGHSLVISVRLLRQPSLFMCSAIATFSLLHRLQLPWSGLYLHVLWIMLHLMFGCGFKSLFHMYCDKVVALFCSLWWKFVCVLCTLFWNLFLCFLCILHCLLVHYKLLFLSYIFLLMDICLFVYNCMWPLFAVLCPWLLFCYCGFVLLSSCWGRYCS